MAVKKGPTPRFTPESVIDSALALANDKGLAALNLRTLAGELGVTPMTLYGYVDNKDDLLERMLERAFVRSPPPSMDDADWRLQVEAVVTAVHDLLVANPAIVEMLMTGVPAAGLDAYRERLFAVLLAAGFDEPASVDAVSLLLGLALGLAIVEAFRRANDPAQTLKRYRALPKAEFPSLRRVATAYAHRDASAPFADGLSHLIASLGSPSARS